MLKFDTLEFLMCCLVFFKLRTRPVDLFLDGPAEMTARGRRETLLPAMSSERRTPRQKRGNPPMNSFLSLSLCRRSSIPKMRALMTLSTVAMYEGFSVACSSFMITLKRYCCIFTF